MTSFLPPAPAGGSPADAQALNQRAIARLVQGDLEGALADFCRCVELAPGFAEAWNNSGLVRQRLGRLAEARADFDHALTLRPTSLSAGASSMPRGLTRWAARCRCLASA